MWLMLLMKTNRLIYYIIFITFLNLCIQFTAALPNKRVVDDEIAAILARQAEFTALDVPFTDQITVVSGSAPPVTPVPPPVTIIPAAAAPAPNATPVPPPAAPILPASTLPVTPLPTTTLVEGQQSQTQPDSHPNSGDNSSQAFGTGTGLRTPSHTTVKDSDVTGAPSLSASTSLSLPTVLPGTHISSSSSASAQSEPTQVSPGSGSGTPFFENRTAVGATFGTIGGILVLGSVFILWCYYRRQPILGQRTPSPDARSSFDATTGLITDDRRDATTSMYDDKLTIPGTSEKGGLAARLGRMRGPVSAAPSATVSNVNSASGGTEPKGPRLGASIDLTAGALVLRVPESLTKLEPNNRKKGQTTQSDDKLGTPTLSDPRWSSSSQIARTRPTSPVSAAPSLQAFAILPPLPPLPASISLPATPITARRRTFSSGNASGFHYVRASERLTTAAQETAKGKDKELSRRSSANSSLSNLTKARISAPIPHAPPKIEIFLRNSISSQSSADERGENLSTGKSADAPISGMLGIDRWSLPSSSSPTGAVTRPESTNVRSAGPTTANPLADVSLNVGKRVLESMDREKEAGRGWSGGSLIGGVEWPDPPTGVRLMKQ